MVAHVQQVACYHKGCKQTLLSRCIVPHGSVPTNFYSSDMVAVDLTGATQWLLVGTISDCICKRAAKIASAKVVAFEATTKAVPI